ncbi:MAG: carotenoid biosynthesis protein [Candidatus Rokubacteria bacterium]|nr:carotenoid biosynthesis protein [Candidatus Rokubacteria bacterium]
MTDLPYLLLATVLLRPYVFAFLAAHLFVAGRELGGRRTLAFTGWAWAVAFAAEFASTRTGVPFGLYHYTGASRGQELYLANVPFMDSLSFGFLAYASFALARLVLDRARGVGVVFLSGLLMMLLDVVIDPLAVRGDRWFLGAIFYYPEGGAYFGVPLSNFLGWAVVGWVIVGAYSWVCGSEAPPRRRDLLGGIALYYAVLVFNLAVTWWIGELLLLSAGVLLHAAGGMLLWLWRTFVAEGNVSGVSSAGFARATLGGRLRKGGEAPLRGLS